MIIPLYILLVIHLGYYLFLFSRILMHKPAKHQTNSKSISILTCYHNEEENINKNLPYLITQNEKLVAVDDNSSDRTYDLLYAFKNDLSQLIQITEDTPGKKKALKEGIRHCRTERILLTDADCRPATNRWAKIMNNAPGKFVLGYAPMEKVDNPVAIFSRYETYLTAIQYLSYAIVGIPYMGVGRNMIIDRKYYLENEDKIRGEKLASGDDDLMVSALANGANTGICIDPSTFVYSTPKTNLKSYLWQKARHITTSNYYSQLIKILLFIFSASQIGFYLIFFFGLALGTIPFENAIIALGIKWGIQSMVNFSLLKKLQEKDLYWWVPILDIIHALYLFIMPFILWTTKDKNHWN